MSVDVNESIISRAGAWVRSAEVVLAGCCPGVLCQTIQMTTGGLTGISEQTGDLYSGDLIFENDAVCLWHHPREGIVHHEMKTVPTSEQFRELLTRGADLLEHYGARKWLSDDRNNTVVREPDSDWAETVWFPRAVRAGFKYWGIVLPKAAIGKLNMRRFATQYAEFGVDVTAVSDPREAYQWLKARGR